MRRVRWIELVLIAMLGLHVACAGTVPATVTVAPAFPISRDASICLLARAQRHAISVSLEAAGISLARDFTSADFVLDVHVGSSRASRDCGMVHNVSYTLHGQGLPVMVIKGRGATGSCDPSLFDDMSLELAAHMLAPAANVATEPPITR